MLGRAAYHDPYLLAEVDRRAFGETTPVPSRAEALERFMPYVEARLAEGVRLHAMTRHVLGLFQGQPGARAFRRHLSERAVRPGAGAEVLREALGLVQQASRGTVRAAAE